MNFEQKMDKIFSSQEKYIEKQFGPKAAEQANYGWGQDGLLIETKVYGHGVLVSTFRRNKVLHDFHSAY